MQCSTVASDVLYAVWPKLFAIFRPAGQAKLAQSGMAIRVFMHSLCRNPRGATDIRCPSACMVDLHVRLRAGGDVGLMGAIARQVLEASGAHGGDRRVDAEVSSDAAAPSAAVYGVIPASLVPREVSGVMRGETLVVQTMHERKDAMARAADCFIALPGGCAHLLAGPQTSPQPRPHRR